MSNLQHITDGMENVVTGLGTRNDKSFYDRYANNIVSQQQIDAAYNSSTWFRKIVKIPVDDSLREGWTWKADDATITKIEGEQNRLNMIGKIHEAQCRARKDGGAIIVMGGLPGATDQPIDLTKIPAGSLKYLLVLGKGQVTSFERDTDVLSPEFGNPKMYIVGSVKIHPSRCIRFIGEKNLDYTQMIWDGFGQSIYSTLEKAILNVDKTSSGISHLIDEAKIDVIKMPGLTAGLATAEYEALLVRRFMIANMLKSINNMLILDGGDGDTPDGGEQYEQKQISFAGLPDVLQIQLAVLAGASDIPATRLLGKSPDGMNASGAGDLQNYYDRISSDQKMLLTPILAPLFDAVISSALGNRPSEVWYEWNPLYTMTEKEAAEVEKIFAETLDKIAITGLISNEVLIQVAQNGMVERGQFPGMEKALAENANAEPPILDDPDQLEAESQALIAGTGAQKLLAADAAPRSLYVRRDVTNKKEIIDWAVSQGFQKSEIVKDLHVTLMYSPTPVDWMKTGEPWQEKIEIKAGGPRMVDQFGKWKVILFNSSEMSWRHEEIKRAGAKHGFPDYSPHVSIVKEGGPDLTTIKPYTGRIVLGPEIYEEIRED